MSASLKDKSVIVTGGSKGIGKGIARVFAGHDAKTLIVARHLMDAEAAAQELSAGGATVSAFAADVTLPAGMEAMAKASVDRHGGLDVLCANAGIFPQARIEEMTPESWDEVRGGSSSPHPSPVRSPATLAGLITVLPRRGNSASCAPRASSWRSMASP
jgi:3-oxoacyl-[acyl-carrier protein] reductase